VSIPWAQNESYPINIKPINKNQADYKTPENTLAAGFSALMNNDLNWYYETLTTGTALMDKAMYEEAGLDLTEKFKLVNPGDKLIMLDKKTYKNGMLILIKGIIHDGTIITGPNIFVEENGLWKETFEYISDEKLLDYYSLTTPGGILNAKIQLNPNQWNLQWYEQMINRKSNQDLSKINKVPVQCKISSLKDIDGNIIDIEDIDPETVLLNYVVKPISWSNGSKKETTSSQKPHLLIKFSKFEAMASIEDLYSQKIHNISISGKLKDNETWFRGETQINILSTGKPGGKN
jgi:hypothetical protein